MTTLRRVWPFVSLLALPLRAQQPVQPPTSPITAVLVNLTIKPDVDRAQIPKIMPDEVRATVRLYLDGKIQQWFSRGDGRGVVFIMNASSAADAKTVMEQLPLSKNGLVNLEYTELRPLTPLRALLSGPPSPPPDRGR